MRKLVFKSHLGLEGKEYVSLYAIFSKMAIVERLLWCSHCCHRCVEEAVEFNHIILWHYKEST